MISGRKIVALTPVKNEAWILPLFCQSASIWADYIIIADQGSTDNSREIALQFPKVTVINNDSADLDEGYRDGLLVRKARELVGYNGIFLRIDADELFTPNFESDEWKRIKESKAGTIWFFDWLQINKDFCSYWKSHPTFGAFIDDGREYNPHGLIHARELFIPDNPEDVITAQDIGLLHFQFVDWNRMRSKHRWYQCYERINFPQKSAIDIYRMYHWMYDSGRDIRKVPSEWTEVYLSKYGIDLHGYVKEKRYWWDDKTEAYLKEYSPKFFRHIETYCSFRELMFAKGKSIGDKLLLLYMHCTTRTYNTKRGLPYRVVRKFDSLLKNKIGI